MAKATENDRLADRRYVTVILRLVLDHRGRVLHGELVEADGGAERRFRGWRGLTGAIRAHVASVQSSDVPGRPEVPG